MIEQFCLRPSSPLRMSWTCKDDPRQDQHLSGRSDWPEVDEGVKSALTGLLLLINSSIWTIDGTLTGTTNLNQSGPRNNGNEEVLHIP